MEIISKNSLDPRNPLRLNVGRAERLFSSILGISLLTLGLKKNRIKRVGISIAGLELLRRGLTGRSYLYRALDVTTRNLRSLSHGELKKGGNSFFGSRQLFTERVVTVNKPREELFQFWSDFRNMPLFMENVEEVRVIGDQRTHWIAYGPAESTLEWDAQITDIQQGESISWETVRSSSGVRVKGRAQFADAPGGRGTEIRVRIEYAFEMSKVGHLFFQIFGRDPDQQLRKNLRLFKKLMETGEIIQVAGQTSGRLAA